MRLKSTLMMAALCLVLGIGAATANEPNEPIIPEITEAADAKFDDADGLDLEQANANIWDHFWNFAWLIRRGNTAALVQWVELYRERGLNDEAIASVLLAAFKYEDYTCRETQNWLVPTSLWLILTCERLPPPAGGW